MFTSCRRTVVARGAVIHDAGMIEHSADKGSGVMTDSTILIGQYMAARFTYGKYIVMTGAAVIHDACMIKGPGYKARGQVAHMAVIAGRHMIRRRCFASGGCTIVT